MNYRTKFIIIAIVVLVIIIITLLFYFALRNKTKDVSRKEPYSFCTDKDLITINEAILVQQEPTADFKEYQFRLEDYEETDTTSVKYSKIPKGSVLQFQKAIQYDKAVSGSKYVYLLGFVINKTSQEKISIVYRWGSFKTICISEPCNYWEHRKAPWQIEIDSTKYFDE